MSVPGTSFSVFQRKLNASATGGTAKGIGMKEFAKLTEMRITSNALNLN